MNNIVCICPRSDKERLLTLKSLVALGFKIHGEDSITPEWFVGEYNYKMYPSIRVDFTNRCVCGAGEGVTRGSLQDVINFLSKEKLEIVFPQAAKYRLVYQKDEGEKTYKVSAPIEASADSITVYAFKHGVRTFKKEKVLEFSLISCNKE